MSGRRRTEADTSMLRWAGSRLREKISFDGSRPTLHRLMVVIVPVMKVGIVRMFVAHRGVMMRMVVRLARRVSHVVGVLVMGVVDVAVRVIERLVPMRMDVPLCQVEIEA